DHDDDDSADEHHHDHDTLHDHDDNGAADDHDDGPADHHDSADDHHHDGAADDHDDGPADHHDSADDHHHDGAADDHDDGADHGPAAGDGVGRDRGSPGMRRWRSVHRRQLRTPSRLRVAAGFGLRQRHVHVRAERPRGVRGSGASRLDRRPAAPGLWSLRC